MLSCAIDKATMEGPIMGSISQVLGSFRGFEGGSDGGINATAT